MGCSLPSRSTHWLLRKATTAWAIVTRFVACSFMFVLPSFRLVQDQPIKCQVKEEEPPFSRRGGGGPFTGRFIVMSLRKPLRPRRGGGWDEAGRERLRRPRPAPESACSLLPGRRKRPHSPQL